MKPEAINICGLPEPATKLLQQNLEQSPAGPKPRFFSVSKFDLLNPFNSTSPWSPSGRISTSYPHIHALEPRHAPHGLVLVPAPRPLLARFGMSQRDHETVHAHSVHLSLGGFGGAVPGLSSAATSLASSTLLITGAGPCQSNNALTSSPVTRPTGVASR